MGAPRTWSRAVDHQRALERALALADDLDVDLIVHSGDVFDRSRPPWRWVVAGAEALRAAALRRPVVVISGNHDRLGLTRTLPQRVPDLHIIDRPGLVRIRTRQGSIRLACVPYRRNVIGWVHGATQALAGGADLLIAHQAFDGVVVPGLTFRVGAQRDTVGASHLRVASGGAPSVQAILCGHIHPRQVVDCGGVPVVHPGCLTHTAMRDRTHPEGIAIWDLEHRVSWRFIDLPVRPLVQVRAAADLQQVVPGALVRVRADGELGAWLDQAVAERGGWLLGRSQGAGRPSERRPRRDQQLGLFPAYR